MVNIADMTSASDKYKYVLSKNEAGNYVFSEEERINFLKYFNESDRYYIFEIVLTLSDQNKVRKEVLEKLDQLTMVRIMLHMQDIDCIKIALNSLPEDRQTNFLINSSLPENIKYELILGLNLSKSSLYTIFFRFNDQDVIKKAVSLIPDDSRIVSKIEDLNERFEFAKKMTDNLQKGYVLSSFPIREQVKYMDELGAPDGDKGRIICAKDANSEYVFTEEERISFLNSIQNSYIIVRVAETLSDKNKIRDEIIKRLKGPYDVQLVSSIKDINCIKIALNSLPEDRQANFLINSSLPENIKYELILGLNLSKSSLGTIFFRFNDQDVIKKAISLIPDDSRIVSKIEDLNERFEFAKKMTDNLQKGYVLSSFPIRERIKYMDDLEASESDKVKIICAKDSNGEYVFTEEERIELLSHVKESYSIVRVAETLSDKNKIRDDVLGLINKEQINYFGILIQVGKENLSLIYPILKDMNDNEKSIYLLNCPFDEATKYEIIKECELSDSHIVMALNHFESQDIINDAIKNLITDDTYKATLASYLSDDNDIIEIAKTLEDNKYKYEALRSIEPRKRLQIVKEIINEDKYIASVINSYGANFTDEEKVREANELTDYATIYHILASVKNIRLIPKDLLKKTNPFKLFSECDDIDYIKENFDVIDNNVDRARIIINKFDDSTKIEYIDTIDAPYYRDKVIESISDPIILEKLFYKYLDSTRIRSHILFPIISRIKDSDKQIELGTILIDNMIEEDDISNAVKAIAVPPSIVYNALENKMNTMFNEEERINAITDLEEFDREFNKLSSVGSKYRCIVESGIPEKEKAKYIASFAEKHRFNLIRRIFSDDETRMLAYHLNPFEDECLKENYINFLSDEINKCVELKILSDDATKLKILANFKSAELIKKGIEAVTDTKVFAELFETGEYALLSRFSADILQGLLDEKQIFILGKYREFTRGSIREHFKEYIQKKYDKLDEEEISMIAKLIFSIDTSNSEEVSKQADSFLDSILPNENPEAALDKVEKIFIQNHLPYFAKAYLTFLTVHPDFESYSFKDSKHTGHLVTAPVLNESNLLHKKVVILSDLIRCNLGSNNKDFKDYLSRLEYGNSLYLRYKQSGDIELNEYEKLILEEFRDSLYVLYDNTLLRIKVSPTDNVLGDIATIDRLFAGDVNSSLADHIVSSYCHFIGVDSINKAREYMQRCVREADARGTLYAQNNDFSINQGDFVKGFDINYFFDMMQMGIVAKDYLGADMDTDCTALDTDLSRIWGDTTGMSINEIISKKDKDSGYFGQGYIIIKDNPEKIRITKKSKNDIYSREEEVNKSEFFDDKLEAFANGQSSYISNPYGIRTGFPSSMIDYIVFDEDGGKYRENIYKLVLPIVMNGYYIPIVSKQTGKLMFTRKQYDELRTRLNGLKQYGVNEFKLSENIDSEEFRSIAEEIDDSSKVINLTKNQILKTISEGLDNEYDVITYIDGKLLKDELQVLDIGSTGRGTNIPYDGDFDFIVRINRDIDIDNNKKEEFIKKLLSKFTIVKPGNRVDGDIKEMVIKVGDANVKLDLSFVRKTNKVSYSSEMCVSDRLSTIKHQDPEAYKLVLANIIYAKKYLKENECYKKGQHGQGGLGGIGVENWILQHGGSFYDAAKNFVDYAYLESGEIRDFVEFVTNYQLWDFGENFYTARTNSNQNKKDSLHDNFISKNLTSEGYKKMCAALKAYVDNYTMEGKQKG